MNKKLKACPFCGCEEDDFDLPGLSGLKIHLQMGDCEVYNKIEIENDEYPDRTYTPNERQLDTRIDGCTVPGGAWHTLLN